MNETDYKLQLMLEAQDNASRIVEELSKKVQSLQKTVQNSNNEVKKIQSTITSVVNGIKSAVRMLNITAVFATATIEIKKGIDSIVEYESAVSRLSTLVKNSSGATQGQINSLVAQAEALDRVGVATKESIVAAQSQLATFDMSTKAIETLTPAITDYVIAEKGASASAEDFKSMTNGLAQALNGNYASLTRTGFILDEDTKKIIESGTEMEKVQAIVKVLENTYKGFNETVARSTIEGQMIMTEKAFGNLRDTVASAFIPVVQDAYRKLEDFYNQATEWVENHQDEIERIAEVLGQIAGDIFNTVSDLVGEISDMATQLTNSIVDLVGNIGDAIDWLYGEGSTATEEGLSQWAGDWSDFFYVIRVGINSIVNALNTLYQTAKAVGDNFSWAGLKEKGSNFVAAFQKGWGKYEDGALQTKFGQGLLNGIDSLYKDVKKAGNEISDAWNSSVDKWVDDFNKIYADRVGQVRKGMYTMNKDLLKDATSLKDLLGGGLDDDTSGGSGSGAKSAVDAQKEMIKAMQEYGKETAKIKKQNQEYYKSLDDEAKYYLSNQKKLIDDLDKEYQQKFDDIQDKIDETEKTIKSLNDSIANLKQSLADLQVSKNKSIASEFINARKELKSLEEQYEGLKEVADSVTREDLASVGGVGKFDKDLITKYKDYQDEINSVYDGMSASEKEALDREIEYAEWYDSLNGIQKIKEDYRIRQEEIQNELNSKLASLESEQETLRQYKKEQQKLQDEWIKRIDEEVKKYEDMYDKVKKFEETYMEQLETDHLRQVQMTDKLIEQWNAVYRAKMRAMSGGDYDGARASGGPVYQGSSYLVGEAGPELFVPSTNGKIINNSDLNSMGNPISINIDMGGVNVSNGIELEELADAVVDKITRSLELSQRGIRM